MELHRRLDWAQQCLRRWSEEDSNTTTTDDDKAELAASLLNQEGQEVPINWTEKNKVLLLELSWWCCWSSFKKSMGDDEDDRRGRITAEDDLNRRDWMLMLRSTEEQGTLRCWLEEKSREWEGEVGRQDEEKMMVFWLKMVAEPTKEKKTKSSKRMALKSQREGKKWVWRVAWNVVPFYTRKSAQIIIIKIKEIFV